MDLQFRKIRNWHNKKNIVTGKRKTGHNGNYEPSFVVYTFQCGLQLTSTIGMVGIFRHGT